MYQDGSSLPPRKSGTKPLISARFASWCSQLANGFPFSGMCLPPALSSLRGWKNCAMVFVSEAGLGAVLALKRALVVWAPLNFCLFGVMSR